MRRRIALALLVASAASVVRVDAGVCEDVMVEMEPPVVHERVVELLPPDAPVPMSVLLPPGYERSGRRYPVLYLLGGWALTHRSWLTFGNVIDMTSGIADEQQAIVVMPWTGDWFELWVDLPDRAQFETILMQEVIPFVDAEYRTLGPRHRAAAGMSGGGISSELLGAHRPDAFAAVGGLSGTVDLTGPNGEAIGYAFERASWGCGGRSVAGAQRDPVTLAALVQDHNVVRLAHNFEGVHVYASVGTGDPCDDQDRADILDPPSRLGAGWQLGEGAYTENVRSFDRALTAAGIEHTTEIRPCGLHSWRYFSRDLRTFWDLMFQAFGSSAPDRFSHSRVLPAFSVWGWSFTADPARASEFLHVTEVSCDGLGLTGSGVTSVRTAACFVPGATVELLGAREASVVADADGRISFTVDLGPAHAHQQYSAAARALEAAGGYWASKRVVMGVAS